MRKSTLIALLIALGAAMPALAQIQVSKARVAVSAAGEGAETSTIPNRVLTFGDRAEARELRLVGMATKARAVTGPRFAESRVLIRSGTVLTAKADENTGKVWIAAVADGTMPMEYGFAGFKSPALSHAGAQALDSVEVSATATVRGMHIAPGSHPVALHVWVYADGRQVAAEYVRFEEPGEIECRIDRVRLEPGVTYHAEAVLSVQAGSEVGSLVAVTDAEIDAIRWSF